MAHSHTNAFDFLRVAAALLVLFSHSFPLFGLPEPAPVAGQTFGSLAVAIFFALSGYLVTQSWYSDPHMGRFAVRRALRIFPGLCVVTVLTVFLLGPAVTRLPLVDYFQADAPWRGLFFGTLGMGGFSLPGVFEQNPLPGGVNGSLWTIKYELLMYVSLALTGAMVRRIGWAWLVVVLLGGAGWLALSATGQTDVPLPGAWRFGVDVYANRVAYLSVYFFMGVGLYVNRQRVPLLWPVVACGVLVLPFIANVHLAMVALWLFLPYAVIVFAFRAPHFFSRLRGYDYSYGIYIYAFPVQQVCVSVGKRHGYGWGPVTLASLLATLLLAILSWYLVEKPALKWKDRLRTARIGAYVPQ